MKKTLVLMLMVFICNVASASVVTFLPSPSYFDFVSPYMYIDINQDGLNDFLMTAQASQGSNESWFKIRALTLGTKVFTDGAGKVVGVNDGTTISSSMPANMWADSAYIYRSVSSPFPFPVDSYSNLAFQFSNGSNIFFGYIGGIMGWDQGGQGFVYFTIWRVGYETSPNTPIVAGATTSTAPSEAVTIPEFEVAQSDDQICLKFDHPIEAGVLLLDLQGRTLLETRANGKEVCIPTEGLSVGCHIVQVVTIHKGTPIRTSRKFWVSSQR